MASLPREIVSAIRSDDLETFLGSAGWVREAEFGGRGAYWAKEEHEVLVPLDERAGDYTLRIAAVLAELEVVEDRNPDELVGAITAPAADYIQVALARSDGTHGSVPMREGVGLYVGAEEMMAAAAASTFDPRPVHARRRPAIADEYLASVRFGTGRAGSYAVTLIAPLDLPLASRIALPNFGRRACNTLARSLTRVADWAIDERGWRTQDLPEFVRVGVSADLCAALVATLGAGAAGVTVRFSWSDLRPSDPEAPREVHLPAESYERLQELGRALGGRYLRVADEVQEAVIGAAMPGVGAEKEVPWIENVTVSGYVTTLSKRSWIHVHGPVLGEIRSVRIDLAENDYELAIEAHRQGRPVMCSGDLEDRPRIPRLHDARDFRVTGLSRG